MIIFTVAIFEQVEMCQHIQASVSRASERFIAELSRHNYVTPTSYLELLGIFQKLISMKKSELNNSRKRTKTGLDKVSGKTFCRGSGCSKCVFSILDLAMAQYGEGEDA